MQKLYTKLSIFLIMIIIFAFLYKTTIDGIDYTDAIHISLCFQTFTGSNLVDIKQQARNIASLQIILSYILITYFVYDINM
jgi:hypothetical protein